VFAVAAGWAGIPKDFPLIGGIIPDWFAGFLNSMLGEEAAVEGHSLVPLLTSLLVSLGGLCLGWLAYRNVEAGAPDPLEGMLGGVYGILKNKYYVDEFYQWALVRPAYWLSETFSYLWVDKKVIDGCLHAIARAGLWLGKTLRNFFDMPVINGSADTVAQGARNLGYYLKIIQTGRVQQYLLVAFSVLVVVGALFYYFLVLV
jgi:NADH-quinone oxidoreductase subunit L